MKFAPIVVFTYNRLSHTKKLLFSLSECEDFNKSKLFIYADGFKKDNLKDKKKVLEVKKELKKFKRKYKNTSIIYAKKNFGLYKNLTNGISKILAKYPRAIILEDDLVLDKNFINYMNKSLVIYEKNRRVLQITGYCYPVNYKKKNAYFLNLTSCWGWATWRNRWFEFIDFVRNKSLIDEIYKKIQTNPKLKYDFNIQGSFNYFNLLRKQINSNFNSWGVLFYLFSFYKKNLNLFPPYNLVNNIGFDGSGAHKSTSNIFNSQKKKISKTIVYPKILKKDDKMLESISYFLNKELNFINKIVNFIS